MEGGHIDLRTSQCEGKWMDAQEFPKYNQSFIIE
jgi:hypothetical protein